MFHRNKLTINWIRCASRRLLSTTQSKFHDISYNDRLSDTLKQNNAEVLTEKYRGVTLISLNRPDKRNALSKSMLKALAEAVQAFDRDETSSVGILSGIGGNFSVGYDLDEISAAIDGEENILENLTIEKNLTEKPIICNISGYCTSLGLELALLCDVRYMEENALLQFSNRQLGIPLVNGGPQRLAKLIGASRAADWLLTGREINANEAKEIGFVSCVLDDGACLGRSLSTAMHMASFPSASLKYDKKNLYASSALSNDKIDSLPADVLEGIKFGLGFQFSEKTFTYFGSKKPTRYMKYTQMAEWERDEFIRETEYYEKIRKSAQNQSDAAISE